MNVADQFLALKLIGLRVWLNVCGLASRRVRAWLMILVSIID